MLLGVGCQQDRHSKMVAENINIIPKPAQLTLNKGTFLFTEETRFIVPENLNTEVVQWMLDKFKIAAGLELETLRSGETSPNTVHLMLDDTLYEEGYELIVKTEGIALKAKTPSGFLYGLQTLSQLLPVEIDSETKKEHIKWHVPNVHIQDSPRFKWRGLMLDVSRHFFSKAYIMKTLDRMAMLKLNRLHLHLVDDQGWRLEIKKYPKLTEIGAFRVAQDDTQWNVRPTPKAGEVPSYGGFYTQEDIKEIVAYASTKGVTVVPEIELPAHVMSAIAAYPELSCFKHKIMVPSGGVWPITEIYCPGKEVTFEFLENVLLEVMELFPSEYIHIGGDEATKTNWESCPDCQKRMASQQLENVEALQSYFVKRMEGFISSHGRKLMGWDEILEGGLPKGAAVMSWRGTEAGLKASQNGHDVVMTPTAYSYFDYYQGDQDLEPLAFGASLPLSKVYQFNPLEGIKNKEQENHILGGQANLWSEYIPTESHSEYMLFPRISAMSEALWSPEKNRNWNDFSRRMQSAFKRYELLQINYAKSVYQVQSASEVLDSDISISLKSEFPNADIRYVLNEEDLETSGKEYKEPIRFKQTGTIKAAVFVDNKPAGDLFTKHIEYHSAMGKPIAYQKLYNENYPGDKDKTLVNVLRGSKDFHDGQWQGWLVNDMEVLIDMGSEQPFAKVVVGSLENQGAGIYFPEKIEVFTSVDGKQFQNVGSLSRTYRANGASALQDFELDFEQKLARYVKVKVENLGKSPTGGDAWLFIDEILVL
jgi:hexosaminidase